MVFVPAANPARPRYDLECILVDASHGGRRVPGPNGARPPCRSVVGLLVEKGQVDGVDVSGLAVLAAGERDVLGGPLRQLVLVDERATPEQVRVLTDLVAGRLGRLGTTLGGLADDDLGVYQAPTRWTVAPERVTVSVRGHLELSVGTGSADMALDVPEHDLAWCDTGCPALRGEIHLASGGRS